MPAYILTSCDNMGGVFFEAVFFAKEKVLEQPQLKSYPIELIEYKDGEVTKYLVKIEEIRWTDMPVEIDGRLWHLPYIYMETKTKDVAR